MFKRSWFEIVDAIPATATRKARAWDLGATESGGDPTVGLKASRAPEGVFYIEDVKREQFGPRRRRAPDRHHGQPGRHGRDHRDGGVPPEEGRRRRRAPGMRAARVTGNRGFVAVRQAIRPRERWYVHNWQPGPNGPGTVTDVL